MGSGGSAWARGVSVSMNATKTRVRTIVEARVRICYPGSPLEAPMSNSRCRPPQPSYLDPLSGPASKVSRISHRGYQVYPTGHLRKYPSTPSYPRSTPTVHPRPSAARSPHRARGPSVAHERQISKADSLCCVGASSVVSSPARVDRFAVRRSTAFRNEVKQSA